MRIHLLPLGEVLEVDASAPLKDILFARGVEFPCGGRGRCKGCKVKVLSGTLEATAYDCQKLSSQELQEGWRLACCARAESDLILELAQWDAPILSDESKFDFQPGTGWGVAVDLGTTTIVAQLVDLETGHVLGVSTALNSQAVHGADIMSRVEYAITEAGETQLRVLVLEQLGGLIKDLVASVSVRVKAGRDKASALPEYVTRIVVVGNTVMHHLFSGISVEPLSHVPFEPSNSGLQEFGSGDLGWAIPGEPRVFFLPCLGGFVGSDILAGILATKLQESSRLTALIDLGTNGEIVVGKAERMLCASTAAGPAFEGARISMGMRAATGAISEVRVKDGMLSCHVLGGVSPRGICGSGLVDAIAAGLDLGLVKRNGRLSQGDQLPLLPPVSLTQWDIRELQLAKGAIAAGLELLLQHWGAAKADLEVIHLAGAFGNYLNHKSACRIGLLNFEDKLQAAGNTALLGAKLALFASDATTLGYADVLKRVRHVSLHEDPRFQEAYVEQMSFPTA